jgi:hypothetical protein
MSASEVPLARIFPGKMKFWTLAGNSIWKEIGRKLNELPGK